MTSHPTIRFRCEALRPSGATDIRVVHASSIEAARDRLIATGLEPVTIQPIGPSLLARVSALSGERIRRLRDVRPALLPQRTTLPFAVSPLWPAALLWLAATSSAVMLGAWGLAFATQWQAERVMRNNSAAIARYHMVESTERVRSFAAPITAAPGISEVLGRLAALLPADTGLVEARRDSAGKLSIILDTPDPDRIRPVLAKDPLFRTMRDVGQVQTDEGTMRVTLTDAER